MSSQSDLVGGEQNGQTVQPLVANQNDQNVKSLVGTKRARNPGKDKKYRAKKKQEIEKMERQLEEARKENADLKITNAFSNGKLAQALLDMDLIKGYVSRMKEEVTQNTASINRLQQLVLAGTIFGPTMGPLPQSHQVERAHWNNVEQPGDWTYNGDVNYTSLPGAAIASGSSLMQGSLAPVGQWNNVEQPGLTYGGLTYDGDLNYTSLPGAAIASGSSLMQGSLAPVGQGNNSEQPTPYNADQFRGVN